MSRFNMQMNETFERDLTSFMELRGIATKSEAVRVAVREGVKSSSVKSKQYNFRAWLGAGLGPGLNPNPKFESDDDLWEKG